jgi:hypothetical protein
MDAYVVATIAGYVHQIREMPGYGRGILANEGGTIGCEKCAHICRDLARPHLPSNSQLFIPASTMSRKRRAHH